MQLSELVEALMRFETLRARQWVADALTASLEWSEIPRPTGLGAESLAVAAGVVEMMAERLGQSPPAWTTDVPQSPTRIYLVRWANSMPRLRTLCEQEGPEPLRQRQILAPPGFLTVA